MLEGVVGVQNLYFTRTERTVSFPLCACEVKILDWDPKVKILVGIQNLYFTSTERKPVSPFCYSRSNTLTSIYTISMVIPKCCNLLNKT